MDRFEEMSKDELLREIRWLTGQQELIEGEFRDLKEQLMQVTGDHRALEDAFRLKDQELEETKKQRDELKETLTRERRLFAQGDTLKHLFYSQVEAKGERWTVITGCDESAQRIVIPERIEGNAVIGVDTGAFSGCTALELVDLPYGVRAIAEETFQNCKALTRVVVPRSVIFIGKTAFEGCSSGLIFEGAQGSYAEWFAQSRGFRFEKNTD